MLHPLELFRLDGKSALVTGASRGIGLGVAEALASAGADVALCSRNAEALQTHANRIAETTHRRAVALPADLADTPAARETVEAVAGEFGRLDVLVNNAGVNIRRASMDYTEADWDEVIGVNLRSAFFVAQAAARLMTANGGGSIINTASMLTFRGRATVPAYAASKGGIGQLTKALAVEWAEQGIRVNAIAPGFIATEMTAPLRADPGFDRWVLSRTPLGRWGQPRDMAGAAVFLASDASAFVTGQILAVDGGFLAG